MSSFFQLRFNVGQGRTISVHERSVQYHLTVRPLEANKTPKHSNDAVAWGFDLKCDGATVTGAEIVEADSALGDNKNPHAAANAKRTKFQGKWTSARWSNNRGFVCTPADMLTVQINTDAGPSTFYEELVWVHPPPEEGWAIVQREAVDEGIVPVEEVPV